MSVVANGRPPPRLQVESLHAGYRHAEILHGVDLQLGVGESMCLVGPNGAGKSTLLNAIFGLAEVYAGRIRIDGEALDPALDAAARLGRAGIAYVLQGASIFPDLSVERNLRLGGYLMRSHVAVAEAVEGILTCYPKLAARRRQPAGALSGGERRLLEIARALMMRPRLLLIDEPSIGLEPRAVAQVFEMLRALQSRDALSILMVEQNVRQGLGFADHAHVMVAGRIVATGSGRDLLNDGTVGRLFLGA